MTKRICLSAVICICSIYNSFGQQNWGGGVDSESLHFGFTFQYVASEFKILKTADWKGPFNDPYDLRMINSKLLSLSSPVLPGFGLGFVSDLRLGKYANLRFTPGLVFADRIVRYEYENTSDPVDRVDRVDRKVQSTFVDLPVGFKLKSDRQKNFRAYLIGGAKYSLDIGSKKKTDDIGLPSDAKYLKNSKNTLWYEAGIGLDLYFEFFKLSPEIKFAQSMRSVLNDTDRTENPYTAPIDKLFIRNFQFSLYFE